MRTIMYKQEQSAGDGVSTPALKPTSRVNQSLKQAPQNGGLSPKHFKKKIKQNKKKNQGREI